jgi:DNA polymerase-3 subunit delta
LEICGQYVAVPAAKKKTASKKAIASNLFAVIGTDDGRVKEEALKLCNSLTSPDAGDFGNDTIDGTAENSDHATRIMAEVMQSLQTMPFFGDKVVWLKGANFFADNVTGRSAATLEAAENLAEVIAEGIPESIKFILSATEIDKRRGFYKKLSKYAKIQIFDKPDLGKDGWEEQAMLLVRKLAMEKNLNFDSEALELFVMLAGADTRQVVNELEKLDLFLGPDRAVTTDIVKQLVSQSRAGVVFELGSAIEKRDLPYALELIDQLLYRGESAIGVLLAAIVPRVRFLMLAKDLQERCGVSSGNYNGYLSSLGRLHQSDTAHLPKNAKGEISGYPLFLASRWLRNFELPQLRAGLEACLDANRKLVTTSLDHTLVLNRLVIGLLT